MDSCRSQPSPCTTWLSVCLHKQNNKDNWVLGSPVLTVPSLCDPVDPWRQACAPWQCDNGAPGRAHTVFLFLTHTHTHSQWTSELLVPLGYNPLTISSGVLITCPFASSLSLPLSLSDTHSGPSLYRCAFGCGSHFKCSPLDALNDDNARRTWPTERL